MKKSKSILFVSKGTGASSTRYRALQFFPELIKSGFQPSHVTVSGGVLAFLNTLWQAVKVDVVIVQRRTFPLPLLWLIRGASKKLIFDFDDAIFCNSDGSASLTRMKRFSAIVRVSDVVFAGNQFLAEKAVKFNSMVKVVPTCVDHLKYREVAKKSDDFVDLVWIGSRSTRNYLLDILPALEDAARIIPNLRLKIVADFGLPEANIQTVAVPWNEATEAIELANAHIGIAPMRNDDWSRGKCALKVLQYMAVGLPVISSAAGVNADIVLQGESGCLVTEQADWVNAILRLAKDVGLREKMGARGLELVEQNYSISAVAGGITSNLC